MPAAPPSVAAPLSHAAVDIAFTRCKASNSRRLTFEQWLRVLCVLSDESGWNLFEMTVQLAERLGAKGFPAPVVRITLLTVCASMKTLQIRRQRCSTHALTTQQLQHY